MKNIEFEYINKEILIPKIFTEFKTDNNKDEGYFLIDLGSDISIFFDKKKLKKRTKTLEFNTFGNIEYNKKNVFNLMYSDDSNLTKFCSGILGLSFLADNNIKLDFNKMRLSFNVNSDKEKFLIPSYFIDKYLIIEIKIMGKKFNFLYDTGSSSDLVFFENRTKDLEHNSKISKIENGEGLSTNDYEILNYDKHLKLSVKKFQLDTTLKIMKENNMSNQVPAQINGIIGNKIFSNGQIIIDYKNQEFYTIKE